MKGACHVQAALKHLIICCGESLSLITSCLEPETGKRNIISLPFKESENLSFRYLFFFILIIACCCYSGRTWRRSWNSPRPGRPSVNERTNEWMAVWGRASTWLSPDITIALQTAAHITDCLQISKRHACKDVWIKRACMYLFIFISGLRFHTQL